MPYEQKFKEGRSDWQLVGKDHMKRVLKNNYRKVGILIKDMEDNPRTVIETQFSYFRYVRKAEK